MATGHFVQPPPFMLWLLHTPNILSNNWEGIHNRLPHPVDGIVAEYQLDWWNTDHIQSNVWTFFEYKSAMDFHYISVRNSYLIAFPCLLISIESKLTGHCYLHSGQRTTATGNPNCYSKSLC